MKYKIAIVDSHHLGDAVMALPFINEAKRNADTCVICHPRQAGVYALALDKRHIYHSDFGWKEWLPLGLSQFPLPSTEIAVSIWPDMRIHRVMKATGAARVIGYPMTMENIYASHLPHRKRKLALAASIESVLGSPLTQKIYKSTLMETPIEQWQKISKALGWVLKTQDPPISLENSSLPSELNSFWESYERRVLIVHPGAAAPMRRWPESKFKAMIAKVSKKIDVGFLVIDDGNIKEKSGWPNNSLIWKPADISAFLRVLSHGVGACCNDSFPAHAAAAMGIPVVTIFSSQEPDIFAPDRNRHHAVFADVCEYRPCLDCCMKPSFICLDAVTVEMVVHKIEDLILAH